MAKVKTGTHKWRVTFTGVTQEALEKMIKYSSGATMKKVEPDIGITNQDWVSMIRPEVHQYDPDTETCSDDCKYAIR
mgnify:FL=1|tara:strand:- start:999 stop:1229 length:231 start_codon:yes stop_codon:yes gene_type:complete